jgi:2-phospho-L-lactate/phosphoenolpyruvate guanylyltransferase
VHDNGRVHRTISPGRWTVVVPFKASAHGKSRIAVDPRLRSALALAMALDTVAAATAADGVREVLVVGEDHADCVALARIPGVRVLLTRRSGLNQAIDDGLRSLAGRSDGPVAVLPGDLPSLSHDELDAALTAAMPHSLAVVADRQGTGTTLLAASSIEFLQPRYGAGSLGRHRGAGAVLLDLPVESGLRRDVDHVADLRGVTGSRTVAVLSEAGWAPPLCAARPAN